MSIYLGNTEIGQIYLGSTEIGEAYLGSTKVFEAGGGSGGGELSDYVQDGLIFHLDGIERGNTAGHWIDRIGNVDFVFENGVIEEDNYVVCNKNNSALGRNMVFGFNETTISQYTIECVFEVGNWETNFIPFAPCSGIGMNYTNASNRTLIGWRSSSSSTGKWVSYILNKVPINTISLNTARGLQNGEAPSNANYPTYSALRTSSIVGFLDGKIYAIRIYNRQLTATEMLKNQKVDNIRFNLGLTLPDTI